DCGHSLFADTCVSHDHNPAQRKQCTSCRAFFHGYTVFKQFTWAPAILNFAGFTKKTYRSPLYKMVRTCATETAERSFKKMKQRARVGRAVLGPPRDATNLSDGAHRSDAPYQKIAADLVSTSYGTGRQPVPFARACCTATQRAASAIRARQFAGPSKNPASRAAREGTRPFHARARLLSHRDRAIAAHRRFEFLAG